MNQKLEQLLNEYKDAKFAVRNATDSAARKAARKNERVINSQITDEFYTITDAEYAKDFMKRQQVFEAAFTFTREATSEAELK